MGCGDEKLSKSLTQTFTAHCNAMICQQVTLSGDAEWPNVADAPDALCDLLTLLGEALLLTPGRFEPLLGLLKAHGRLWGATRTALLGLVPRRLQMCWHLLELLLSFSGRLVG